MKGKQMKLFTRQAPKRISRLSIPVVVLAPLLVVALAITNAEAAATPVPLKTARRFAVLAGSGITNTGLTGITGDIGTFPTTSITGTSTLVLNGTNHGGDAVTQQAKKDLVGAYINAANQGPVTPVAGGILGGLKLVSGVYNSASSMDLTGTLTLNGQGRDDSVFIFQVGSALTTASASQVRLVNGAQGCNVFWQIGSSATLGTGSTFEGSVMALTSITANTGARVHGRLLARNGAVTLDTNRITRPTCATGGAPTPTPTASATATPTPSATATPSPTPSSTPGVTVPHPNASPPKHGFGLTG
jgi:Ice-binding-like